MSDRPSLSPQAEMVPNKHSTASIPVGQEGCDWAVLIPRDLWNMKGIPSGWQWISKVKLKGSLVSMETPGKSGLGSVLRCFLQGPRELWQTGPSSHNKSVLAHVTGTGSPPCSLVEHFHSLLSEVHEAH